MSIGIHTDPNCKCCFCKGKRGELSGKNNPNYGKENKWGYHTEDTKKKMRKAQLHGNNNPLWKGENVSYRGLHKWIVKNLGQPTKCEDCGKDGLTGRQIDWANKDHLYKRDLSDYRKLCRKCHNKYDIEHGLRNNNRDKLGRYAI